jgi:hypothetical protein
LLHQQLDRQKHTLLAHIGCINSWHLEQLHSEVIWHKVFLPSNKLTKLLAKAHGQHITHLSGLSTFALLVAVVVVLGTRVVLVAVVAF